MANLEYKNASNIKTIFMDLGGVVIDIDAELSIKAYEKMGVQNIREFLNSYKQEGPFLSLDKGLIDNAEFFSQMRRTFPSLENYSDAEISAAHMAIHIGIPKERLDFILELKKHFKIVATSNVSENGWNWCRKCGFDLYERKAEDYFDEFCLSYCVHLIKPDADFFEKALELGKSAPQETLLIDDSPKNCEVASSLGIHVYNPKSGENWSHMFLRT